MRLLFRSLCFATTVPKILGIRYHKFWRCRTAAAYNFDQAATLSMLQILSPGPVKHEIDIWKKHHETCDGFRVLLRQGKPVDVKDPGIFLVRMKHCLERWSKFLGSEQNYEAL
ncbi:hypothetical protein PoB_000827400 [Plakobranchus ocellatus]|uniref:Uncharacterized protein n=1 Tax=Plakobranchus ocellatus TaxID=259542 RepID=A0AAV3YHK7_9GAST|nr:hypothetical protein PoB_000827400 [Plakobranchus ocellatus]